MKTTILRLTGISMALVGVFSCVQKPETEEQIEKVTEEIIKDATKTVSEKHFEYIDGSFPDLPWLKETTGRYKSILEAGSLTHATIHQCTYKDGIGFLLNDCVECADGGFVLINNQGVSVCCSNGWYNSCKEFNIDLMNTKLIWEIQPNPPVTVENLYKQPLAVISKCVQGKWILHKLWDGMNHYYDWTTFVYISEKGVAVTGNEGINFTFSYSWKKNNVSSPYPNISPYSTYVMWNDKLNRGEWSFFALNADMLEVNLCNSGVYTLIRVRDEL